MAEKLETQKAAMRVYQKVENLDVYLVDLKVVQKDPHLAVKLDDVMVDSKVLRKVELWVELKDVH